MWLHLEHILLFLSLWLDKPLAISIASSSPKSISMGQRGTKAQVPLTSVRTVKRKYTSSSRGNLIWWSTNPTGSAHSPCPKSTVDDKGYKLMQSSNQFTLLQCGQFKRTIDSSEEATRDVKVARVFRRPVTSEGHQGWDGTRFSWQSRMMPWAILQTSVIRRDSFHLCHKLNILEHLRWFPLPSFT